MQYRGLPGERGDCGDDAGVQEVEQKGCTSGKPQITLHADLPPREINVDTCFREVLQTAHRQRYVFAPADDLVAQVAGHQTQIALNRVGIHDLPAMDF